jgi:hypothetical protein
MSHKYHVTIEDCIDEEDTRQMKQRSSMGINELDLGHIHENQVGTITDFSSRGSKRQAWV